MYNLFDRVMFTHLDGSEKQGKIIKREMLGYWIKVGEDFSYELPIENNGKITGYVPMQSQTIDYFVMNHKITGKVNLEDAA